MCYTGIEILVLLLVVAIVVVLAVVAVEVVGSSDGDSGPIGGGNIGHFVASSFGWISRLIYRASKIGLRYWR